MSFTYTTLNKNTVLRSDGIRLTRSPHPYWKAYEAWASGDLEKAEKLATQSLAKDGEKERGPLDTSRATSAQKSALRERVRGAEARHEKRLSAS